MPYLSISAEEVTWLKEHKEPKVTLVSLLVWSQPGVPDQPLGSLRGKQNEELRVFGILGVDPSSEVNVTHMDQAVIRGALSDLKTPYGAVISQKAANQLGVDVGDILPFHLRTTGFYKNLTIVGIVDDEGL